MSQAFSSKIPVRAPRFDFTGADEAWLDGDPVATRVVDALSLIFPEGERFFIRSVKHYAKLFEDDPDLVARVRGFIGQEGRHGHEHDKWNRMLAERGYPVERFLEFYKRLAYERIEGALPPHLRLATTVALEHMTSTLAIVALSTPILDEADPRVRPLLYWHAVEEIEHRAVTFDVLAKVDPRLSTRALGFAIGTGVLGLFWVRAYQLLAEHAKDGATRPRARFRANLRVALPIVRKAVLQYFRPSFHPEEVGHRELIEEGLARAGVPASGYLGSAS